MTAATTIQVINRLNDAIVIGQYHHDLSDEKETLDSGSTRLTIAANSRQEIPRDNSDVRSRTMTARMQRNSTASFRLRFCVPAWQASSAASSSHDDASSEVTAVTTRSAPVFLGETATSSAKTKRCGQWQTLDVSQVSGDRTEDGSPRRITALQVSRGTTTTLLLLPTQSPSNFMSHLPDTQSLSSMCIPGTHETFARFGWPISQCQEESSTIAKQLQDGIRFMDLRVRPDGEPGHEKLWAFHGSRPQHIELGDALDQVYDFLDGVGSRGEPTRTRNDDQV